MGYLDFVEPFTALMNQGEVRNQGKGMSKSLGNGVDLGEQIGRVRRRRGPADDGLRRPARGRHRLGGRVARRLAAVPAAGLAAERRRRRAPRRPPPDGGDVALRRVTHKVIHDADPAARVVPLQRRGRAGDGAGQRHPQGDRHRLRSRRPGGARGGRDRRDRAEPGRALHRRGDVVAAGPRSPRSPRPAGRPPIDEFLVEDIGDLRRPGAGQGARQAGGVARRSARTSWRRWRWPSRTSCAPSATARCAR